MTTITLTTHIAAPVDRVFDLARCVDAHLASAQSSGEHAVAGKTCGLLERGDTVTWEARHLGIRQRLTVRISRFDRPTYFEDIQIRGAFKSMTHQHHFQERDGSTVMTDHFEFTAPFGILGACAERWMLKKHLEAFLRGRNAWLKECAEGTHWQEFLPTHQESNPG